MHTQSVCEPVHEIEVRHDLACMQNGDVVESVFPQRGDVAFLHLRRRHREPNSVVNQRAFARRQSAVVRGKNCSDDPLVTRDGAQCGTVVLDSILACVRRRHHHGDHLTIASGKRRPAEHDVAVERIV